MRPLVATVAASSCAIPSDPSHSSSYWADGDRARVGRLRACDFGQPRGTNLGVDLAPSYAPHARHVEDREEEEDRQRHHGPSNQQSAGHPM
jgi:hypothetical protein